MPKRTGTVVRLHGHHAWVRVNEDEYICPVRGKFKQGKRHERSPLAVGDRVTFTPVEGGEEREGLIESIAERETELYRAHPRYPRQRQVLAANIELLVIVAGAERLEEQLITVDRLLISAFSQGLTPIIAVNKTDLRGRREIEPLMRGYAQGGPGPPARGIDVLYVSALEGDVEKLKPHLKDTTAVFAGMSGAGKSSLMNALEPGLELKVGAVDRIGEGRHTTTHVSLIPLAGGLVIDTPGVRDFGFWNAGTPGSGIELHEISLYYPDWEEARARCRFNTCTHRHEPACGVKAAAESGELDKGRYERYLEILREAWNEQKKLGY